MTGPAPVRRLDPDSPPTPARVPSSRLGEAAFVLVGPGARQAERAERFLQHAAAAAIDLRETWGLPGSDGRLVAVAAAVPNPGRTALVFASEPRRGQPTAQVAAVIDAASTGIAAAGVVLAQGLLDPDAPRFTEAYVQAGFHRLAMLSYLERPLVAGRQPEAPTWPDGLALVPAATVPRARLVALLDATYEDTLDCPGLCGLRRTEDILEGHERTGVHDPALWLVLRDGEHDLGLCLVNRSATSGGVELVYVGMAPRGRRRGLARRLLHDALRRATRLGARTMSLAVDDANAPAVQLYRNEGFRRVARRLAMIRPLAAP